MREILFRGKRTDNSKWVDGYLRFVYVDVPQKASIYSPKYVRSFDVISETVGQYTGLTDKNGIKIFEGDIVQHGNLVVEVAYIEKYTRFAGKRKGYTMAMFDWKSCEIIGNIYDNPELLEVKNG